MTADIKKLVKEEKWRRWHNTNNIHVLSEQDPTRVIRQKTPGGKTPTDPTKVVRSTSGRRQVKPDDIPPESSAPESSQSPFTDPDGGLTDAGKAALKANTVWTNNLTQLLNFQAGKRLSQNLGRKLAKQTKMDAVTGEQIAAEIMKQVLETMDDLATEEMEKTFPGIFTRTRG